MKDQRPSEPRRAAGTIPHSRIVIAMTTAREKEGAPVEDSFGERRVAGVECLLAWLGWLAGRMLVGGHGRQGEGGGWRRPRYREPARGGARGCEARLRSSSVRGEAAGRTMRDVRGR
jgi:hypothetical protein